MKPAKSFSVLSFQRCEDVFLHSFWVSSFHSRTFLQATLALSLVVSWLKSLCCDFSIFSAVMIACPLFNLVRNSVVHSPSSVIRDPRYGNVLTCSSCSFWMSIWHTMPSLAITFVLSTLMSSYLCKSVNKDIAAFYNGCWNIILSEQRINLAQVKWSFSSVNPMPCLLPATEPDCFVINSLTS